MVGGWFVRNENTDKLTSGTEGGKSEKARAGTGKKQNLDNDRQCNSVIMRFMKIENRET